MSLQVSRDLADDRRVSLRGELDTFNARDLVETLVPLARQGGDLSLELSQLAFMDSGGIRAILLLTRALGDGSELLLISPRNDVARVLELVGAATFPKVRILPDPSESRP